MTAADPAPPPLTPEQQAEADKLYRAVLALRVAGVRQFIGAFDGEIVTVRAAGNRVDIAILKTQSIISTTS